VNRSFSLSPLINTLILFALDNFSRLKFTKTASVLFYKVRSKMADQSAHPAERHVVPPCRPASLVSGGSYSLVSLLRRPRQSVHFAFSSFARKIALSLVVLCFEERRKWFSNMRHRYQVVLRSKQNHFKPCLKKVLALLSPFRSDMQQNILKFFLIQSSSQSFADYLLEEYFNNFRLPAHC
jgi:hypothetical protein